jgi:hypothetical protein
LMGCPLRTYWHQRLRELLDMSEAARLGKSMGRIEQ